MEVQLTPGQRALIRDAIASGRLRSEEDAVQEAILLWEQRERRHVDIQARVGAAAASLARGEDRIIKAYKEVTQLAEDIKRRGLERFSGSKTL